MSSSSHVVFVKNELIRPDELPNIDESDGFFNTIKKGVLKDFKVLVWSKKMNKWVYVLYDGHELKKVKSQLGNVDCFTLKELWILKDGNISEEVWIKILDAKRVFNATVKSVRSL
jgi:hypothetical protein